MRLNISYPALAATTAELKLVDGSRPSPSTGSLTRYDFVTFGLGADVSVQADTADFRAWLKTLVEQAAALGLGPVGVS